MSVLKAIRIRTSTSTSNTQPTTWNRFQIGMLMSLTRNLSTACVSCWMQSVRCLPRPS